jgi:hypothetical protein
MRPTPQPGDSAANASEGLRDARLVQALRHMPDAHLQPDPQTRHAVLQAAFAAVAMSQPTKSSRWRTLWQGLIGQPGHRMPLTGAVASVLVASFITLMWYEQEVPDANPSRMVTASAPPEIPVKKVELPEPAVAIAKSAPSAMDATLPHVAQVEPAQRLAELAGKKQLPAPVTAKATVAEAMPEVIAAKETAPASPAALASVPPSPPPPPAAMAAEPRTRFARAREQVADAQENKTLALDAIVAVNGQQRTLTPARATALMAALRALAPSPDQVHVSGSRVQNAAGVASGAEPALAHRLESAAQAFTFTAATGEVWEVSPGSVRFVSPQLGVQLEKASRSATGVTYPITPTQWEQLRALAAPAGP